MNLEILWAAAYTSHLGGLRSAGKDAEVSAGDEEPARLIHSVPFDRIASARLISSSSYVSGTFGKPRKNCITWSLKIGKPCSHDIIGLELSPPNGDMFCPRADKNVDKGSLPLEFGLDAEDKDPDGFWEDVDDERPEAPAPGAVELEALGADVEEDDVVVPNGEGVAPAAAGATEEEDDDAVEFNGELPAAAGATEGGGDGDTGPEVVEVEGGKGCSDELLAAASLEVALGFTAPAEEDVGDCGVADVSNGAARVPASQLELLED